MIPAHDSRGLDHHAGSLRRHLLGRSVELLLRDPRRVPGHHFEGQGVDLLGVGHEIGRAAEGHAAQLVVAIAVFDQHRDAGVALEIQDLLRLRVGLEDDVSVHDREPQRREVGRAVSVQGGDLQTLPLVDELPDFLVAHPNLISSFGHLGLLMWSQFNFDVCASSAARRPMSRTTSPKDAIFGLSAPPSR